MFSLLVDDVEGGESWRKKTWPRPYPYFLPLPLLFPILFTSSGPRRLNPRYHYHDTTSPSNPPRRGVWGDRDTTLAKLPFTNYHSAPRPSSQKSPFPDFAILKTSTRPKTLKEKLNTHQGEGVGGEVVGGQNGRW